MLNYSNLSLERSHIVTHFCSDGKEDRSPKFVKIPLLFLTSLSLLTPSLLSTQFLLFSLRKLPKPLLSGKEFCLLQPLFLSRFMVRRLSFPALPSSPDGMPSPLARLLHSLWPAVTRSHPRTALLYLSAAPPEGRVPGPRPRAPSQHSACLMSPPVPPGALSFA